MSKSSYLKQLLGVLLLDIWRYERALRSDGKDWIELCNRNESLSVAPEGLGVQCNWRWTSQLHAPRFVSSWGKRLMRLALSQYPIDLGEEAYLPAKNAVPEISFIIGHRGRNRLPLLLLTLRSIANQKSTSVECIVVEESGGKEIEGDLPSWVRYIHLPTLKKGQPYNRARTFNAGARDARGNLLVLHDNDLLVPSIYACELLRKLGAGFEVINLKRFIFYLTEKHTKNIIKSSNAIICTPDFVLQNTTGGGSLAVEKNAYFAIGGFDEGFVGWGGEDVEFWERANTLKLYNYGFLPIVHLWHPPQPGKTPEKNTPGMRRLGELTEVPLTERIKNVREKNILNI